MDMQIVIVDDSAENVALLGRFVSKLPDCFVQPFTDPLRALDWCAANSADLVIVDYQMPGLDGLGFIGRFRALPGHIEVPVVMVTASDESEVRQQALDLGATEFLTKPVGAAEFVARTRNLLRLRASTRLLSDRAAWLQREVRKATAEIEKREEEMLFSLGRAAEFRDPETGAHIQRMANYSSAIARRMGLSEHAQRTLLHAAPLHDIGKLGVPDAILLKPGRLTAGEFDIMKRHAAHGHDMIRHSHSPVIQAGATIALAHHEKWDGSGYPSGLAGRDIPLFGRIVAVADVFDALTSARPYKPAWEIERACGHIRDQSGAHFDPACVQAFFGAWPEVLEIREAHRDPVMPHAEPAGVVAIRAV